MESLEKKALIYELSKGRELAKELMSNLQPSSSQETRDALIEQILSSYEKAISALSHVKRKSCSLESPQSLGSLSPRSVIVDQVSNNPSEVFKKRKTIPRWSEKVKVCVGSGVEGPLDDGYNWRKYGQKDILGANHPRGYYRCTHRNSQGCLATKQVQKSDEDSSLFEITYRGRHTCTRFSEQLDLASPTLINQTLKHETEFHDFLPQQEDKSQTIAESALASLKAGLEVKTEDLVTWPTFSFPDTSASNYFSELSEILSAPASVTNSPIMDFSNVDFEFNFFDSPEFFA